MRCSSAIRGQLLKATNRLAEAEPLMRRLLEILFKFAVATGHEHPHLQRALRNYAELLWQMGRSTEEVRAQLDTLTRPFGIKLPGS